MVATHQLGLPELVIHRRNSAVSSLYQPDRHDRPDGTVKDPASVKNPATAGAETG
jgi:hypothetical protein